jgi:hypothetical protein
MITIVTAFVPIPDHPRSEEEYHRLGKKLLGVDRAMFAQGDLEKCWLYKHLERRTSGYSYSTADNPKKNSLAYHIIQAQKTEWLLSASLVDPFTDVFVWIDYGIFHLRGVTTEIIRNFLQRAENEQAIAIPGCWEKDKFVYDDNWPCWRWCGGLMIVPRQYVSRLDTAMKNEYISWLDLTKNISWEVNTLARVEQMEVDLPFWWYKANHDYTMFTNYQATEDADGEQTKAGLRGLETRHF